MALLYLFFSKIANLIVLYLPRTKDGLLLRTSAELTPQLFPLLC